MSLTCTGREGEKETEMEKILPLSSPVVCVFISGYATVSDFKKNAQKSFERYTFLCGDQQEKNSVCDCECYRVTYVLVL